MKKITIALFTLVCSQFTLAQIGVNTPDPKSTFDITAKSPKGKSETPEGLLVPRVDRERAQSMIGTAISTLIYVDDATTGLQTGTAINIDNNGYYYFDGRFWMKLSIDSAISPMANIYNTNGVLDGNRIVTQNDKTLAFTGTATNGFSVDGNTFSVDAANNRIGIGTTAPNSKLHVQGNQYLNAVITAAEYGNNVMDINIGQDGYAFGNRNNNFGINVKTSSSIHPGNVARFNFGDASMSSNGGNRFLSFSVGKTLKELLYMDDVNNGRVGIGTSTPNSNAILELSSTNQGFLPPRLTTAQRDAIPAASRPAGLMIYNTNTNCMNFWNTNEWVSTCANVVPPVGAITALTCTSATNNGSLNAGSAASAVTSSIPYTGGNGGSHGGQSVTSTGVTGLTATLSAGSFANGNGSLTYTITGTPSAVGTASFALNIGGRTCTLTRTVTAPVGAIASLNCAGATNNGTLTGGASVSGVSSSIPYTGGNSGTYSAQTVNSTGVTGLTATLSAGTFANGNGNLTYTITGTPSAGGTASFAINIGGRTCTLTRTVAVPVGTIASLNCAGATNNGTLTGGASASGVSSSIPYTGGNSGTYTAQTVSSTGVTGLTATLAAGSFANGNGNLTYTITGTPTISGTASFAINIGGKTCTLTRTVAGAANPPTADTSLVCNGWTIPFVSGNGNSTSTTVNGQTLTATVTKSNNSYVENVASRSSCLTTTADGASYKFTFTSQWMTIKFDKAVSNLKVYQVSLPNVSANDRVRYTFRKNGVEVIPSGLIIDNNCRTYNWSGTNIMGRVNTAGTSGSGGTIYNFGGVWFDEVTIASAADNGNTTFGSQFSFCVGSVQ
ncbi:beta strand repeat-containing protein [Chryseobacterium sp. MMS23-Vi53]|uniref:beta strand repeat-containing protein n=1 Tax=Chryseobacterium sp. MMS23-Vi53 TaxID=3386644 RepID=UPI0039EC7102